MGRSVARTRSSVIGYVFVTALAAATPSATSWLAAQQIRPFQTVTDAVLQNPPPADWLMWRRTLDSWGYSPLKEIDTANVAQLRMVWARPLNLKNADDKALSEGKAYNFGFAVHDDNITTRGHHISFPVTVGFGAKATIEATRLK